VSKKVLAIDVGGVLASLQHDGEPVAFSKAAIKALRQKYHIVIVSQCGKNRAAHTKLWLAKHNFGIPLEDQYYVSTKESKAPVLTRLRASFFVDDRFKHVMPALAVPTMESVFHFTERTPYQTVPFKYRQVGNWKAIVSELMHRRYI